MLLRESIQKPCVHCSRPFQTRNASDEHCGQCSPTLEARRRADIGHYDPAQLIKLGNAGVMESRFNDGRAQQ